MNRKISAGLCAAAMTLAASNASADTFVRMLGGPTGGSWYPLGAKIMEIFEREIDGVATNISPGGGMGNVRDVDAREAEMGWTFTHTAHEGFTGAGAYDREHPNVRHFATAFEGVLHAVVPRGSDIQSYRDLAGRDISPGQPFVAGITVVQNVLDAYDMSYDHIRETGGTVHHVSFADSVTMMKDGHIDAYFAVVEPPHASVIELNFSPGIRLLSIDDEEMERLLADNPPYMRTTIPAGTYEGIDEDIVTIGVSSAIIVHADVPDDLVYEMCRVFWDNQDEIRAVHEVWGTVSLENAISGAAIPLHPGVERCYGELGVELPS
jgi:uncharacterized protein